MSFIGTPRGGLPSPPILRYDGAEGARPAGFIGRIVKDET
jgi:hypothetical protein